MGLKQVYKILDEVKKLVETKSTQIEYKRVYIPKKIDTLGNPLLNDEGK